VRGLSDRYGAAVRAIDAANGEDPNVVHVRGEDVPLALAHGRLAAEWVLDLHPDADDALLLAARAHHLRRWQLPRTDYPDGRAGYLRWRREQKRRHAVGVAELLRDVGYDDATVDRVAALVRRDDLSRGDPGAQAVEDAACLVFIETQLGSVAPRFDREHLLEVIRKTAAKMSPAGLAAVARIPLGAAERDVLAAALG
jgi:hypothetical protein